MVGRVGHDVRSGNNRRGKAEVAQPPKRERRKAAAFRSSVQRGGQREFEDLLAVLIFSPVRWEWMGRWFGFVQQRQSSDTAF